MAGRKLDDLIIGLQLTTKALEQGMNDVKKKLNSHANETKRAAKGYDELAIVAGVAFYKIVGAVNSGVKAFNDYRSSMVGLQSIAKGTGNSFDEAQGFIDNFTKDGLVPASLAAASLKNLLASGFSMNEAADVMTRFKDAAAFGRQGALTMGEAIKGATDGIKNGMSVMVDNVGVTKNLSVMWKEYADTLNKGVDSLTTAEKRQAEYAGIMKETQHQVGDATKYSKEFAGAQAKAAAETLKLQQALGGSIVPTLGTIYSLVTPLISLTTEFIQKNPILSATIITMATTLLGLTTAVVAAVSAFKILKPAILAVTGAMATNPVLLAIVVGLTAIVGIVTIVTAATQKAKKAQEDYTNALKEHSKIVNEGITKSEIPALQEKVNKLKELSAQYDEISNKLKAIKSEASGLDKVLNFAVPFYGIITKNAQAEVDKYTDQISDLAGELKKYGVTQDTVNRFIEDYEVAIKEANRVTSIEYNDQAKNFAQKQAVLVGTQNLIKAYKSAATGSKDWYDAQKKLAEQFPQFASASGIEIKAIEAVTAAQDAAVKAEWEMMKAKIVMTKIDLQNIITRKLAVVGELEAQQKLFDNFNEILTGKKTQRPMFAETPVTRAIREINQLKQELKTLDAFADIDIDKILGVMPTGTFTAYENKALDTALKVMEHKKRVNQLSAEDEIKTLESISKKYARTADEKMDIEERLYDAKQALRDREQKAIERAIQTEADKLSERTERSMRWIEDQKLYDADFGTDDEIAAYNRVIKYHKEYLNKIMADKKISEEEKRKIVNEETFFIQDQQRRIYEIQKAAVEKAVNDYIYAKQKQYDMEERLENERLNDKLTALEKEYSDREKAVRQQDREAELSSLYEQERKYQNAATKDGQKKLADIRAQISQLNKDAEGDRLAEEKAERRAAIEDEIKANQDKYKVLRDDLLTAQKEMVASAMAFAKESSKALEDSTVTLSNSLQGLFGEFDKNNDSMMAEGLRKLKKFVADYKAIMDSILLKPQTALTPSAAVAGATSGGINVTLNDYGDKVMSNKGDVSDYGKEMMSAVEGAARIWGGKF